MTLRLDPQFRQRQVVSFPEVAKRVPRLCPRRQISQLGLDGTGQDDEADQWPLKAEIMKNIRNQTAKSY